MKTIVIAAAVISGFAVSAADFTLHSFKKQQLEKYYWSEGAMLGEHRLALDGHCSLHGVIILLRMA